MLKATRVASYPIKPPAVWHPLTPLYDLGCNVLGFGPRFKRHLASLAAIEPAHRVIDVACGTGVLIGGVAVAHRYAVDPDPGALRVARRRGDVRSVRFARSRAEALPFRAGSFDRVLCTLALHHVPDAYKLSALREMRRVLKPDGWLLLADFDNCDRGWVPRDFRSQRTLPDWLAAAGFDACEVDRRRLVRVFTATRGG